MVRFSQKKRRTSRREINMKQLSLRYDEVDYHKLKTAKEKTNLSWEKFFLSLLKGGK